MSKLIFPKHGGVLVDDRTEVLARESYRAARGTFTIAIVKYPSLNKPYGYHYLDPQGAVTGGSSGNSYSPRDALERAIHSIEESERRARAARRTLREIPDEKRRKRLAKKVEFFLEHAGYSRSLGESKARARRRAAESLARAEAHAEDSGWEVEWKYDQDEYQLGEGEEAPSEVLVAILRDHDRNVLASLGGIADPSPSYRRLVEAELALEAMTEKTA